MFYYLIFMSPAIIFSLIASMAVKYTFAKYSKVASLYGLTGAEAARRMLSHAGIHDVAIERVSGFLSDHYDPSSRTLRLSPAVHDSTSIAAIGVACHEAWHALQHADSYFWLSLRSASVPLVNFGSSASYIIIFIGMLISSVHLMYLGCALFALVLFFSIITLPVEWNASSRAKEQMLTSGLLGVSEREGAASVLNAAFLTYVASAFSSLLTMLYYLMLARGGRRR